MDAPGSKEAAVLVPLYTFDGELHAVFTERRDDMRKHAGEISFPGGRQDKLDEDLRATALREAEEEIGLDPGGGGDGGGPPAGGHLRDRLPDLSVRGPDRARADLAGPRQPRSSRCSSSPWPSWWTGYESGA